LKFTVNKKKALTCSKFATLFEVCNFATLAQLSRFLAAFVDPSGKRDGL